MAHFDLFVSDYCCFIRRLFLTDFIRFSNLNTANLFPWKSVYVPKTTDMFICMGCFLVVETSVDHKKMEFRVKRLNMCKCFSTESNLNLDSFGNNCCFTWVIVISILFDTKMASAHYQHTNICTCDDD